MKKTIKKAQTGAKSDSLMRESVRKKVAGKRLENIGVSNKKYIGKPTDSLMKTDWGRMVKENRASYKTDEKGRLLDPNIFGMSADEKIAKGRRLQDEARKDSIASVKSRVKKQKTGGKTMLKRADGSVSQRGLWDNLRSKAAQNKKTGAKPKAPTKAMLTQEKKIKAKGK
jgi:hypothetical protein